MKPTVRSGQIQRATRRRKSRASPHFGIDVRPPDVLVGTFSRGGDFPDFAGTGPELRQDGVYSANGEQELHPPVVQPYATSIAGHRDQLLAPGQA
jgi:hypothetical protein